MAKSFDNKNMEEFIKNLKAAEKFSKEVNAGFSSWEKAAENIRDVSDGIKDKIRLIAELKDRIQHADEETKKELEAQIALEEEKLKKAEEQLKLLRKQVSLWRTIGNEAIKAGKGFMNQIPGILKGFWDMDGAARRVSVNIGMGSQQMNNFQNVATQAASDLALMGLETKASAEMMGAYAEATGRQVILGKKAIVEMGGLAQRTGMAHGEMAGLVGEMESFGLGADASAEMLTEIADTSDRMGVNTSKVMKTVQKNLKLVNKLSFKGGVKGMMQMAAYSEKYKISMEEVAGFADKVFRPEGAIDAAANLQVLGGSLAELGDPFQIMYQARNAPEELAKSITKAAAATAEWDEASGEFKVSAYELDRLKEASEATGISVETLVETAKQTAKMNMFANLLKIDGEQAEFLQGIAEMKDGQAQIAIDVDPTTGEKQYAKLSELSASEQMMYAEKLKKEKEENEQAAMRAQSTAELFQNMLNSLVADLYPFLKQLDEVLRPMLKEVFTYVKDTIMPMIIRVLEFLGPKGVLATYLAFKAAPWILRGRMLGIGFNMTAGKGGIFKRMAGWFKGGKGAAGVAGTATQGAQGAAGAAGTAGAAGATQGAQNAGAMGQSAGSQATNMLKGAAAILILSAALFVFAKALQEFDKLQNGWGTLALAAVSLGVLAIGLFAISKIPSQNVLMGALAIAALGVALIPFAYGMSLLADVGAGQMIGAAIALGLFALAAGLMAEFLPFILLGSLAIVVLSGAVALFGLAMGVAAPGFEAFIGAFERLPNLIAPMLLLGPALLGMAAGIAVLTISLLGFGLSWLVGGWAFEDMAESIGALGNADLSGLGTAVQAINSVDMNKLEALRDLARSLSIFSLFGGGINIEFGDLDVKGTIDIKGEAGGSKSTDWVNDPIFVSKLKDLVWETMEKDRNGGKP